MSKAEKTVEGLTYHSQEEVPVNDYHPISFIISIFLEKKHLALSDNISVSV